MVCAFHRAQHSPPNQHTHTKHNTKNNYKVRCLNEDAAGSCRTVLRPWDARTAAAPPPGPLLSDEDDAELLLHIPFDGAVKLKAVCVIGGPGGRAPTKMRL